VPLNYIELYAKFNVWRFRDYPPSEEDKLKIAMTRGRKATPEEHQMLVASGYQWSDAQRCYVSERGYQRIYAFPSTGKYLWVWDQYTKIISSPESLAKWINNDNHIFTSEMSQIHDKGHPLTYGTTDTDSPYETKPVDKGDVVIAQIKKQLKGGNRMEADAIIDLYSKAKEMGSEKLMQFVKTLKPMSESIKKSELEAVIKEIVKGILKEMTTTGAVDGFNIPGAFARKGGSQRGVQGSRKLGYELTKTGEKEMSRSPDKLVE
jgi:hypothetical protein